MEQLLDQMYGQFLDFAPRLAISTGVFVLFWAAARILKALVYRVSARVGLDEEVKTLLAKTTKGGLMIFGAVTALGTAGVNVSALVAGLGLTGFAIGFALKDALSNLLAGVLILTYRPFRPGERITVAGLDGTIRGIDLRYTTIDTDDKKVLIPNSTIFTAPIIIEKPKNL